MYLQSFVLELHQKPKIIMISRNIAYTFFFVAIGENFILFLKIKSMERATPGCHWLHIV